MVGVSPESPIRYDLAEFGLKDMISLGRSLRLVARDADTMEDAAGRIVRFFYETLSTNGRANVAWFAASRRIAIPICRLAWRKPRGKRCSSVSQGRTFLASPYWRQQAIGRSGTIVTSRERTQPFRLKTLK